MEVIIGIDPGSSGAISFLISSKLCKVIALRDKTEHQIISEFRETTDSIRRSNEIFEVVTFFAFVEKVTGIPADRPSTAFAFGKSYGGLRYMLAAFKIPYEEVAATVWQTNLKCQTKGDKKISVALAHKLFPDRIKSINQSAADAVLIAEYGRRKRCSPQ